MLPVKGGYFKCHLICFKANNTNKPNYGGKVILLIIKKDRILDKSLKCGLFILYLYLIFN